MWQRSSDLAGVKKMTKETLKEALRTFGIGQVELARAAGLSEAAISRQLNGDLRLTKRVVSAAEELLVQRGAEVASRILEWVEFGRFAVARRQEARSDGSA